MSAGTHSVTQRATMPDLRGPGSMTPRVGEAIDRPKSAVMIEVDDVSTCNQKYLCPQ